MSLMIQGFLVHPKPDPLDSLNPEPEASNPKALTPKPNPKLYRTRPGDPKPIWGLGFTAEQHPKTRIYNPIHEHSAKSHGPKPEILNPKPSLNGP